ncbi:MAG: hypothetical protein PHS92_02575 [Candidatus Gracilibacteria bacterium]|nr:hypothetical protein [Candidatus Gracilibacteria bacterium]
MKKSFTLIVILLTSISLISCSNPSVQERGSRGIGRGGGTEGNANGIIRLKGRGGPNGGGQRFGSGSRMGSGAYERFGSGSLSDEFLKLSEENRKILKDAMDARRFGDDVKSEEILKGLKEKYPDVFSGTLRMGGRMGGN